MPLIDMNDQLFQVILAGLILLVGVIQWMASSRQKAQTGWMESLSKEQLDHTKMLIRIETRVTGLDELKNKQQHDHDTIREMDKKIDALEHRFLAIEKEMTGIMQFCEREHGGGLRIKQP